MIEDEVALLADIRFALRGLDPWPPKGNARPSEDYARRVVEHLRLCGSHRAAGGEARAVAASTIRLPFCATSPGRSPTTR